MAVILLHVASKGIYLQALHKVRFRIVLNPVFYHILMLLEISFLVWLLRFHTLRFLNCFFGCAWCALIGGWGRHVRYIKFDAIRRWRASLLLIRLQRLKFLVQLLVKLVLAAITHALELLLLAHLIRLSTIIRAQVVLVLVKLIERHRYERWRLVLVGLQGHRVLSIHLFCVGLPLELLVRLLFRGLLLYRIFLLWLIQLLVSLGY